MCGICGVQMLGLLGHVSLPVYYHQYPILIRHMGDGKWAHYRQLFQRDHIRKLYYQNSVSDK
jgi:hypothetical protein